MWGVEVASCPNYSYFEIDLRALRNSKPHQLPEVELIVANLNKKLINMTIEEARSNVGSLVMSTDPGRKMMWELPAHGPYQLMSVTKAGLAVLQGRVAPSLRVPPHRLTLYEEPTHSTEETPYYYTHKPGDPLCECDFAQIWFSWPLECRNCGRAVRSIQKAPLEQKVSIYVVTCNIDYEGASVEGAFLSWEAAEQRRLSLLTSGMSFQNFRVEEWKDGAYGPTLR